MVLAHAIVMLSVVAVITVALLGSRKDFKAVIQTKIDLEEVSAENARLASLDMLTGLPNRRHFFSVLGQKVSSQGSRIAVGIVDLDGFKPINDTYGHRVGDKVLDVIANRLGAARPEAIEFCRIGGDEFAFIVDLASIESDSLIEIGNALIKSSEDIIRAGDLNISLSCSVGFAVYPDLADSADSAFEHADFALYQAKRMGRGNTLVFSAEHQARITEQSKVEQVLLAADFDAEFYPLFQPIIDVASGKTEAFECLARWTSPVLGRVSPGSFIPIAEQAGLISNITAIMLRKALMDMATWPLDVKLSFNLSPHDITSGFSTMRIISTIMNSNIDPSRIVLELTETALLNDFTTAQRNIELLKASGLSLALDDFGTGYSSLCHVQSLPLDKLKIDRRFVVDVETNPTSQMIVRSLVALCQGIGIGCVVEGAETEAQVNMLRSLGCRTIQGYYYSRPIEASQIDGFLGAAQRQSA
jgi:diguanylate cyclase (GGDEF)-like protein